MKKYKDNEEKGKSESSTLPLKTMPVGFYIPVIPILLNNSDA